MDMHMERLLKRHGQVTAASARVLEINPRHDLIRTMARLATEKGGADALADATHLLLDQARIVEGETVADPVAFTRRLTAVMAKGLG
jgi:molecular chaperone HtpG